MNFSLVAGRERDELIYGLKGRGDVFEERAESATVCEIVGRCRACGGIRRITVADVITITGAPNVE
jgi:hypothetical protein